MVGVREHHIHWGSAFSPAANAYRFLVQQKSSPRKSKRRLLVEQAQPLLLTALPADLLSIIISSLFATYARATLVMRTSKTFHAFGQRIIDSDVYPWWWTGSTSRHSGTPGGLRLSARQRSSAGWLKLTADFN